MMSRCKYCGKSGLFLRVSNLGLCQNCGTFVTMNMKTLVKQINESVEIMKKTKNPETFITRLDFIIGNYQKLYEYERMGIIVNQTRPSVMLAELTQSRDGVITEFLENALGDLRVKLLGIKTEKAKINQIQKFRETVESFIPKLGNRDSLTDVLKQTDSLFSSEENVMEDFDEGEFTVVDSPGNSPTLLQINKVNYVNQSPTPTQTGVVPVSQKIIIPQKHKAQYVIVSDKHPSQIVSGLTFQIQFDIFSGEVNGVNLPVDDPSTVFKKLPVRKPHNADTVEKLPYYPAYSQIEPEQRWVYLDWLEDICKPIDIGYVFMYYYGLERQLLSHSFDGVFDEICLLRNLHNHGSLIAYSDSALLFSALYMRKTGRINQLLDDNRQNWKGNDVLLVYFLLGQDLTSKSLMNFARGVREINLRYYKENPDLFENVLAEKLTQKYGRALLPFVSKFDIAEIRKKPRLIYANISFPQNMRQINVPDFLSYEPLMAEIYPLFADVHQQIKDGKRSSRPRKKS